MPLMSDFLFKENFRMTLPIFNLLCDKLSCLQKEDTVLRKAISLKKRIAIAIYALGSSAEYRSIGNLFGVGRTTVGEILIEFCEAVWTVLKLENMNFFESLTSAKLKDCIHGFNKLGFPQCYGAIGKLNVTCIF